MGSLFGGGSKTQKVETTVPAYQLPYLQYGLGEALRLYQGGGGAGGGAVMPPAAGAPNIPAAPVPGVPQRPGNPGMPQTMGPQAPGQLPKAITNLLQFRPSGGGSDGRRDPLYPVPGQPGATYASDPAQFAATPGGSGGPMVPGAPPAAAARPTVVGGKLVTSQTSGPGAIRDGSKIYQGPTVADESYQTRMAIDQIIGNSGGIDPRSSVNALTSALNGTGFGLQNTAQGKDGSFGLGQTAAGAYIGSNPNLDRMIESATRGATDRFRRTTSPGITSAAASRGRLGSGYEMQMRQDANRDLSRELSDTEADIRAQDYARERGLQTQAQTTLGGMQQNAQQALLAQRLQASGLLTDVLDRTNESALRGATVRYGVGQNLDARNDARLGSEANRYERTAMEPESDLDRYLARVSGNQGTTQSTPINRDVAGAALGGAGVGAKIGSQILNAAGEGFGGTGAILGGLFGLLSDENAKENRRPVKTGSMLAALEEMPVEEWEYREGMGDGGAARHVGPMAQAFKRATGKGDGHTIPIVDAQGMTMGAIQELAKRLKRLEQRRAA